MQRNYGNHLNAHKQSTCLYYTDTPSHHNIMLSQKLPLATWA